MESSEGREVCVDSAVKETDSTAQNSALSGDTSWLDTVICNTITASQAGDGNIPLKILCLRLLVEDTHFVEREATVSVVDCFNYVFVNIEKIEQDAENISLERVSAIERCSRDLAASHLRLTGKGEVDMKGLTKMVKMSSDNGDFAVAFQAQCDLTYAQAVSGSVQGFTSSILKEVELLLKLKNLEEAYLKILNYKMFTESFKLFSNYLKSEKLEEFDQVFSLKKKLFEKFIDFLDEDGGGSLQEINEDRASATIIVDMNGERGHKDGKFHVKDFTSALKLSQNGGIIFLENGDYSAQTFFDVKQKSQDPEKVITIIGASTNECSIHGTIKIHAQHKVTFKRIKFEIGDSPESNDAIYVLGGKVLFNSCLLEAKVNTLWYLIGQESSNTTLTVKNCVVDGLESCQRAVTFQGQNVSVHLEQSMFRDMFSVVTVLETGNSQAENISLVMDGCEVEDVQTGVHLSLSTSCAICHITCCNITLVLYDQDAHMNAVEVDGGKTVTADNNNIFFKHIDGKGFFIKDVDEATLVRNCVKTTNAVDRKLAVGEAVVTDNVEKAVLDNLHILGFRIGVKIRQSIAVEIRKTLIECCSVGISVVKSRKHKKLEVLNNILKTVYYGVMGEDPGTSLILQGTQFIDIPKALLLCQEMVSSLKEEKCAYLLSKEYTTSCEAEMLEAEMNLYLATSENLPHRVAYEREEVQLLFKFADLGFKE